MPLKLVLGPANSAKAGEILGAYGDARRRGAVLVVPTAADVEHYLRELAAAGSVLGGGVVTFAGLMREIAERVGLNERPLTAVQRERVLRRTVRETHFDVLAASAAAPGFVVAAGALVAELERSLVTPQRFAQAMRAWTGEDSDRRRYAEEVASIYLAYARALERLGRIDLELYAWRALDALREAPGRWGDRPVFFYGFDDLHPLELDAVETLSRVVGAGVTVSLTYEAGRDALAARARAVEELKPLATRVLELPAAAEHYAPGSRTALHHLERRLFEPTGGGANGAGSSRVEPGSAVRLLEAGGELAEAELVAAEVLALLRAGVPGDEIVVVYRSVSRAAPLLARVFGAAGIPLAAETSSRFGHTTLGRSVLALARCALGGHRARADDLLEYLRSPGLLQRPEIADMVARDVRRTGSRTVAEAREALAARASIRVAEIDAVRDAPDVLGELARQARRLFAAPHRAAAPALGADEELDARALGTLERALEQLGELGEPISASELLDVLDSLEVESGDRPRPGAVLLAGPLAIRARRFRAVLLCGLQEGEFPRPPDGEPFLSDERRAELAAASGLALRPREDVLARERYLFYACTSRATERVVLSYRSSDEEGNPALRSPFVADVAELMVEGWAMRRSRRLLADVVWEPERAPTARELDRARAAAGPRALAPPLAALGQRALDHVRHREVVSAGALETYAVCPIKWLVEKELQPERLEPEPEAITRGSYMHAVLECTFRRLGGPVTLASLPAATRALEQVLAELPPPMAPGRSPAVRAAALRAIEADLRRYLEYEAQTGSDWAPQALELRFGFEREEDMDEGSEKRPAASLPALELAAGAVRVRGAIDRVDVDPDSRRAIVRDYKSGRMSPSYPVARWRVDRRLQVALYMLVVRDLLRLEPVAGVYQPLGGPDLRARGVFVKDAPVGTRMLDTDSRDAEELDAELADAAERAVALATRLRSGDLSPCPETCSRNGCAYPGICRSQ